MVKAADKFNERSDPKPDQAAVKSSAGKVLASTILDSFPSRHMKPKEVTAAGLDKASIPSRSFTNVHRNLRQPSLIGDDI
jgi:hypothetical protein